MEIKQTVKKQQIKKFNMFQQLKKKEMGQML